MIEIITATDKRFPVTTAAIGSIDGSLGISLTDTPLQEAIAVFTDPEETAVLTRVWDNKERVAFEGYTDFAGIMKSPAGGVHVTLRKEANHAE